MSVNVWTAAAYNAAFRCGGWAYVREGAPELAGAAGGDRNTTLEQMAFAGLAAALKTLPKAEAPVDVHTPHTELVGLSSHLKTRTMPKDLSAEVLGAWQTIVLLAASRPIQIVYGPPLVKTPIAFVLAWADLARDKAKASGHFISAIPKPNLAKMPGRAASYTNGLKS
jgi:hypothetical protein